MPHRNSSGFIDSRKQNVCFYVDLVYKFKIIVGVGFCLHVFAYVLLDFSLTVKAATLIFISGCGWAISSAEEGKSGFIYNLVKS